MQPAGLKMYQASIFSSAPIQTIGKGKQGLQLDLVANTSGAIQTGKCIENNKYNYIKFHQILS